jgi:hypothetical protein
VRLERTAGGELAWAVLLRYVEYSDVEPEQRVAVKAIYESEATAQREAYRLNALPPRGDRLVRYFVKIGTPGTE